MKQRLILTVILGILATIYGFAQSITGAEYFLDNDPGVGGGVPITLSVPFDTIEQTFDIVLSDTLEAGYHWLYIRSRDTEGKWSIVMGHKIHVYEDANPSMLEDQPGIAGIEYYFDTEPGVGMGTWIANSATIKDTIEEQTNQAVAALGPGYHKLYVRSKDTEGTWGIPMMQKFFVFEDTVIQSNVTSSPLVAAEYYFDDEVPLGGGTPIPVTKGDSIEWSGLIEVTGLSAGEHHLLIRVQDSTGQWSIAYSKAFSVVGLTSRTNSPICQGSSDGEVTISMIGGRPPYTFLWDDPEQQADSTATGLKAGTYTVTVQDAEGAVIRESVEITERDAIQISITTSDTECKMHQGSATAVASGGSFPYEYLWTNGSEIASASGLGSGIYEVTVTDKAECQNKAIATINDIGGPQIDTVGRVIDLKCAGENNGIIDPEISGGTPQYSYSWSNGETTKGIQNLTAGTYELTVMDAQECFASASIEVKEPQPLTFGLSIVEADCGVANGAATVSVTGGVFPYGFEWTGFTDHFNATRTGLSSGVYEVTVTDSKTCSGFIQVAVSEKGAPSVNVTSIVQSSCGSNDGSVMISVAGGTGSYVYDWRNESGTIVGTNKDLIGVGPGVYSVSVSDGSGCETFATATLPAEQPPVEPICLVSVDSASGKNVVVWDETPGKGIVGYRLYRETTSAGVFDSIAFIPVDSLSRYRDDFAEPTIRSWRYRLAAVNNCGVESRLSPPHKTIHLTVSLGLLNHINLHWNHYEGFVPKDNQYRIWRHAESTGWKMIHMYPMSNTSINSYTDQNAPDEDLEYYVEAVHSDGCTPVKAATLNSARSNRKDKLKSTGVEPIVSEYQISVWPNPSSGQFNLSMNYQKPGDLKIKVFDITGKLVHINEMNDLSNRVDVLLDLSGYAKGIYQMHLDTGTGVYNRVLVIQ